MANIVRRRPSEQQQGGGMMQWDPSRMFRELIGWDPFQAMLPAMAPEEMGFVPRFEVKENNDSYVFKADLPGVKESDLEVALTGNRLTVSGRREQEQEQKEENARWYVYERSYGSFTRSFTLPEGVDPDNVKADLKNGELTITVPKKPESQPRKIQLGSAQEKQKAKA